MTPMTRDEVLKAALDLPPKERIAVARELAKSVPAPEGEELPEAEWEAAWVQESERRLQDLREGKAKEIPASEVFARARALRR
jgi:putative addiction module component (TIGR02574 family)